ncbi:MAG: glycosyltransferase [Acidobacteria bacterium]|nr:glycosyltransferase [Acidobacteriota bacterium]
MPRGAETALLAAVAREIKIAEATLGEDHDLAAGHRVVFPECKTVDYGADVTQVAHHLLDLLKDAGLRRRLGEAGRRRASLAHDPGNRGASDTTPLFLLAVGLYRRAMREPGSSREPPSRP